MKRLIMICLLFGVSNVFADSVAKVLFATNKVVASRNGTERTLTRGSSLNAGDTIITAGGAAVNIKYNNGTLVNLGENSNYKILAYTPNQETQIKAELNSGKLKFKTQGKVKETLKTPVMALAILGTEVSVYVPKNNKTYVSVQEGKVKAAGRVFGPGKNFLITPEGIVDAPFPAAGQISTPAGAEGTISADTSSSQQGASAPATTETQEVAAENPATSIIATVAQVADAGQNVGSSVATTNASAAAVASAETLAVLSIVCL
ncbi:MAG TPA: FecR family protein [Legionella sp.]|nr:FecR family protein [Legionella sp.]